MRPYFKKILVGWGCLLFIAAFCFSAQSQTITLGAGTVKTEYFPVRTDYSYSYAQIVYKATEITTAGGSGPALITALRFQPRDATPVANWKNWKVYMANVSFSAFTTWVPLTSMKLVYDDTIA